MPILFISQQQAGGQQVTYRPAAQQIPEEVDEPGKQVYSCVTARGYMAYNKLFWMYDTLYHYITIVNSNSAAHNVLVTWFHVSFVSFYPHIPPVTEHLLALWNFV